MADAVVFDLGGVLLDWNPRYLYRKLFTDPGEMEDFLACVCTSDWHLAHDLGEDITASCERLAREHPGYREAIMAWAERGEEMLAGQFDENVQLLAEVKATGVRCLALSNMEPELYELRRASFAFMSWFDGCVISGLEGVAKPDRKIFEILLDRYRLAPERTVFTDDSPANIEAASALGIRAVQYTSPRQLRDDFSRLGLLPAAGTVPAPAPAPAAETAPPAETAPAARPAPSAGPTPSAG
ncbi:MAG: HAD family hydrolase [Gemmatimonadota bacterium]